MDAKYRIFKGNGQTVVDLVSLARTASIWNRRAHLGTGLRSRELVSGTVALTLVHMRDGTRSPLCGAFIHSFICSRLQWRERALMAVSLVSISSRPSLHAASPPSRETSSLPTCRPWSRPSSSTHINASRFHQTTKTLKNRRTMSTEKTLIGPATLIWSVMPSHLRIHRRRPQMPPLSVL